LASLHTIPPLHEVDIILGLLAHNVQHEVNMLDALVVVEDMETQRSTINWIGDGGEEMGFVGRIPRISCVRVGGEFLGSLLGPLPPTPRSQLPQ
jgi:hypothetical protein